MANPYSKYTGARVQPVPSDYYRSLGKIGEMYERGIASVGKTIGGAIESYYDKKNKHEALDEQYDNLKRFLEPKAKVELPDELGGGAMEIELEGEHPSLADFAEKSVSEKESKVKDMLFLREKFFKDRDHQLDVDRLAEMKRDREGREKIAEERQTLEDAKLTRLTGQDELERQANARKLQTDQKARDALLAAEGIHEVHEKVPMGYELGDTTYMPGALTPGEESLAKEIEGIITTIPAVESGKIPSVEIARAMMDAPTDMVLKILDRYKEAKADATGQKQADADLGKTLVETEKLKAEVRVLLNQPDWKPGGAIQFKDENGKELPFYFLQTSPRGGGTAVTLPPLGATRDQQMSMAIRMGTEMGRLIDEHEKALRGGFDDVKQQYQSDIDPMWYKKQPMAWKRIMDSRARAIMGWQKRLKDYGQWDDPIQQFKSLIDDAPLLPAEESPDDKEQKMKDRNKRLQNAIPGLRKNK